MRTKYDVFLSYEHINKDWAEELARFLKAGGLKIWFDLWEIRPGEPWLNAIEQALQSSACAVLFVGSAGLGSWAQSEIAHGLSEQLRHPKFRVIPVIGPLGNPEGLPAFLKSLTYVDLRNWNVKAFRHLLEVIRRVLERAESARTSPRVFLCHAKEDAERVDELYFMLKDEGFDPWYDKENLVVGDNWEEEIISAIARSDYFAICLSNVAVAKRGFIQKEIRTAVREYQRRPQGLAYLLPLRLEDCTVPPIRLDDNTVLTDFQWQDVFKSDTSAIRRLANGVWTQWKRKAMEVTA